MIHGDLKGVWLFECRSPICPDSIFFTKPNILIDSDRRARLADFGLTTIVSDPSNPTATLSSAGGGTARWMGPELFDPDQFGLPDSRPTKESDCYALGMVIYEVLSGRIPFVSSRDTVIVWKVISGERPKRPQESVWFTDELWETLELCWAAPPEMRPSIGAVFKCLQRVSQPPSDTADESSSTSRNSCMSYHSTQDLHLTSNAPRSADRSIAQGGNRSSAPSDSRPSSVTGHDSEG